jgi:hypothetical protein
MSNLFSDSIDGMKRLLFKSKKVTKGSTLEEAGVEGAWLTAYAQISRRCRDDRDFGVIRYTYELGPGVHLPVDILSIESGQFVVAWSDMQATAYL